ncbi:DUF6519 domain-containing protein [Ancylobacter oerskovii]|uniref:DUF6519 domain-containing protein n=1 Tax=Ancylobacter oerskovii TaxID=459519 RepID=A0ABW4Z0R3_9HYPH|nr:DUF6519 domain-containing protein [Ancylobacter oerskovii]MBS7542777.1 hypothetical protein [Ancylobacter oerskovii]
MSGDYSRNSFDAGRHFSLVRLQQGRVGLDSDWNEQAEIVERRLRAQTVDSLGRQGVPRETLDGFRITLGTTAGQPNLRIGRGRLYVAGLLAENHDSTPPAFDLSSLGADGRSTRGVLGETLGPDTLDYAAQPYWPAPDPLPAGNGPHLVYLDAWQREVTAIEDPGLLEKALGGVDTTTRLQTVWQVRVLANVGANLVQAATALWQRVEQPRLPAGRLSTQLDPGVQPTNPCLIATAGGYGGLENQLYRVEVHEGGPPGVATFKWSRDNGTVATTVDEVISNTLLRVASTGRDAVLGFDPGQWVELTDDRRDFAGRPGVLLKIADVDHESRRISFGTPVPAELLPSGVDGDTLEARRTRLRRWDQAGIVRDAGGGVVVDLDAAGAGGAIPIPTPGSLVVALESGIRVAFGLAEAGGRFRTGDYWTFAARSIDASVEVLDQAPPRGVHRHSVPLALIAAGEAIDLRPLFNPAAGRIRVATALHVDADGRSRPIRAGQEIPVNLLAEGLNVLLHDSVDADSVNDGSLHVTTEIPYRLPAPYATAGGGGVVAYQPVVLPAEIALAGDGVLNWRPYAQTVSFLRDLVQKDVPRLGNVRFEREFEVFDNGGPASRWAVGAGNSVVQTQPLAGTSNTPQIGALPTMAVHRHRLKEDAGYIGVTCEDSLNGGVGVVYNWLSPNDFSLFVAREVWVPVGFSGATPTFVVSHAQIKGGQVVPDSQLDVTLPGNFADPRHITLDIKQTGRRLQFGCTALFAGGRTERADIAFPNVLRLHPDSRVGLLTTGTGTARFTRLQVIYGSDVPTTLVPAGLNSRLLARLVVKRSLLELTRERSSVSALPAPEPDFETWFWLTPPTSAYYGYRSGYGSYGGFPGIGFGRLVAGARTMERIER